MYKQYIGELQSLKLRMYKTVWNYDMPVEFEMYKQYMDELRAKRASNFEARNLYKTL